MPVTFVTEILKKNLKVFSRSWKVKTKNVSHGPEASCLKGPLEG